MSAYVTGFFLSITKRLDEAEARLANMQIIGKVAEVNKDKIRVELGQDKDGKPVLSPWVQAQAPAGAVAANIPFKVGDPVRLLSPNGEIGSSSLAVRDSHSSAAPNPALAPEDLVVAYEGCTVTLNKEQIVVKKGENSSIVLQNDKIILALGQSSIELSDGKITLKSGESVVELGADFTITAGKVKHKDRNIGADHKHGGVETGGGQTGAPV
ncbi:phage baseplate assembly protein [Candidatus Tokpelaia sp.]|uniref:phage baseplate assembly protein n=1 Tax=Candidatus Tokpelaia sp. TaxID=2233777 RepID=UPI0012399AFE|nr:phage baseplate assembly protein [Candidatus Tokpelaia sp.]KAA6405666.1 baseplate assembly protein [Candidatus Tokpelaia sp.]